ncbi:MAG: cell division protein FtsQ/DivIB [Candidatus Endonucleobacter sp. (ex Gigantidas childressi)]|nr:cell division protein FtsQ/DivIB [Candidatus Endonucleobacter sp. (ex Gigantidas childressi)]
MAVKNGKKRYLFSIRLFQVGVSVFFLVILIIVWPRLWSWLNQPIASVEVHAPFQYVKREKVEVMLEPYLRSRFFQLSLTKIRSFLLSKPWVKEVSLKKEWPDKLVVSLEEQEPVARWHEFYLITGEGHVFMPVDISLFDQMPLLKGPDDKAQEVMQQYLAISQLLRPLGLMVIEIELGRTGAWSFNVSGVQVGIGADLRMERLQRFVRLYHARLEPKWKYVKRIDLRYSNGAAVAWDNE